MREIKLIATDFDHTLFTDQGEVPMEFHDYVKRLSDLGILVAVASGRIYSTLKSFFKELKDELCFICDNGATIIYKGENIFKSMLPTSDWKKIIAFARSHPVGIPILCGKKCAHISAEHRQHVEAINSFFFDLELVEDLMQVDDDINKVTLYFPNNDSVANVNSIYGPGLSDEFVTVATDSIWIDVMVKGVNKGEALKFVGERLGISREKMMAFGDNNNDIEMLQFAEFGIAVANAREEVIRQAKYMVDSNNDHGVIKVMRRVLELNGYIDEEFLRTSN